MQENVHSPPCLLNMYMYICVRGAPIVAVSCGYDTCFAVKACDGLYHLTKSMDHIDPLQFCDMSLLWGGRGNREKILGSPPP